MARPVTRVKTSLDVCYIGRIINYFDESTSLDDGLVGLYLLLTVKASSDTLYFCKIAIGRLS